MTLFVHRSNRLESLADAHAEVTDTPLASPFEAEVVVTPSEGMFQWLALSLAERRGIAAHLRWERPRAFLEDVARRTLGEADLRFDAWAREQLTWSLARILPEVARTEAGRPLRAYLAAEGALPPPTSGDAAPTDLDHDVPVGRLLRLAGRLAFVFDQYVTYRVHWVEAWSRGLSPDDEAAPAPWQAALFQHLLAHVGDHHTARLLLRTRERLLAGAPAQPLPSRVALFGSATLPALYVATLDALSAHADVHLFQISPTPHWWADLRTRRRIDEATRAAEPHVGPEVEADLHLEVGHPLLAGLGQVGQEFQELLEGVTDYVDAPVDRHVPPEPTTALGVLQHDLYAIHDRARHADPVPLSDDDRSLQLHVCHSPAREVEVLRDVLLDLFVRNPDLRPRDVLVLTPDIALHGPFIEAVFGTDPSDPRHLPFAVADRPTSAGNQAARALLALFDAASGRRTAPEVLDLLAHTPLRARFGFAEDELAAVEALVVEAGVRWGLDADHRAREGQPPVAQNTWRAGLDRLLLGYALPGELPFGDTVPFEGVEAGLADLVGRLTDAIDALERTWQALEAPRTPEAWSEALRDLVDDLLAPWADAPAEEAGSYPRQLTELRRLVGRLGRAATEAGFDDAVPLDVLRGLLDDQLAGSRHHGAFLRRGITFCEMLPMRSVPARVVCVLGLSDGAFPRVDVHLDFDATAARRRLGDRSKRLDDRHLFLETLLSARDHLVLTWVGRSVQDNAELPPSVVVSELLDVLDVTFASPNGGRASAHLTCVHPLQPFGTPYVTGPDGPSTFDPAAAAGAVALTGPRTARPPFLPAPVPPPPRGPDDGPEEVSLRQVLRALQDPPVALLRRLGVGPGDEVAEVPDREPLHVEGLDSWTLGATLLDLRLRGHEPATARAILLGRGMLPLGRRAEAVLGAVEAEVDTLLRAASDDLAEAPRPPVRVHLPLGLPSGDVVLVAHLDDLRAHARVGLTWRSASSAAGRLRLEAWLTHLVLQLADVGPMPRRSRVHARGGAKPLDLGPLPDPAEAEAHLAEAVAVWDRTRREGVAFLPEASWSLLLAHRKGDRPAYYWPQKAQKPAWDHWRNRAASRRAWEAVFGTPEVFVPADPEDPSTDSPGGARALAETLFGPLHDHLGAR